VLLQETRRNVRVEEALLAEAEPSSSSTDRAVQHDQKPAAEVIQDLLEYVTSEHVELRRWGFSRQRHPTREPRTFSLIRQESAIVAAIPTSDRRKERDALRSACRDVIQARFTLDKGVPYPSEPRSPSKPNVLVADRIPIGRFDPEKPLRAAAFAGWSLFDRGATHEVIRYAAHLRRQLETSTNERQ
jgi:hypothetical protein